MWKDYPVLYNHIYVNRIIMKHMTNKHSAFSDQISLLLFLSAIILFTTTRCRTAEREVDSPPIIKAAATNCGGSFFRHNPNAEAWARDHWYVYFKHIRPGLLEGKLPPIDFHEIIALITPRAFLDLSALNDGNPGTQRQRALMLMRVMDGHAPETAGSNQDKARTAVTELIS